MFVRLPESHCDAQLLDFRVVAAEKLCQEAARDPDITLGQVLTTQHPATEGLYIRARVKKSVGSALPPLVRDQGYRNLVFTEAQTLARCFDRTENRASRHDLGVSSVSAGEAAAKRVFHGTLQGMSSSRIYRSEGCNDLFASLEHLELEGRVQQLTLLCTAPHWVR